MYLCLRSISDRVIAIFVSVLVLPICIPIFIAIRVKMGAPVVFRQNRVGQHGRIFKIVKFRTMVSNAEQIGGGYMPDHLDLIPPLGKFLRRTSLDEIPQLINILRGEMSFVGPRPALVEHFDRYSVEQRKRLAVPQGVTGLAQVTFRNDAPWSQRIRLDIKYVDNVNFLLDFRILLMTVGRVMKSQGVLHNQERSAVDDLGAGAGDERGEGCLR